MATTSSSEAIKLAQKFPFRMIIIWTANGIRAPSPRSVDHDAMNSFQDPHDDPHDDPLSTDHIAADRLRPYTCETVCMLKLLRQAGIISRVIIVTNKPNRQWSFPSASSSSSSDKEQQNETGGDPVGPTEDPPTLIPLQDVESGLVTIIHQAAYSGWLSGTETLKRQRTLDQSSPSRKQRQRVVESRDVTGDDDSSDGTDSDSYKSDDRLVDTASEFWTGNTANRTLGNPGPLSIHIPNSTEFEPAPPFSGLEVPAPPARVGRTAAVPALVPEHVGMPRFVTGHVLAGRRDHTSASGLQAPAQGGRLQDPQFVFRAQGAMLYYDCEPIQFSAASRCTR
jgi:hypothetical protein